MSRKGKGTECDKVVTLTNLATVNKGDPGVEPGLANDVHQIRLGRDLKRGEAKLYKISFIGELSY